jgi:hypothetical protein
MTYHDERYAKVKALLVNRAHAIEDISLLAECIGKQIADAISQLDELENHDSILESNILAFPEVRV